MSKNAMTLFLGKYRKNSLRKRNVDYSSTGYYFVTINTKNRNRYLGHIRDHCMILSQSGQIVRECWLAIPSHYPGVKLGAFIVMPDHFHGIVIISQKPRRDGACPVPANRPPFLGNVIGSFKSATTKKIHESGNPVFGWHRRYHDHIITDDVEWALIDRYIRDNPRRWRDPRS